jgi:hypothetical protein
MTKTLRERFLADDWPRAPRNDRERRFRDALIGTDGYAAQQAAWDAALPDWRRCLKLYADGDPPWLFLKEKLTATDRRYLRVLWAALVADGRFLEAPWAHLLIQSMFRANPEWGGPYSA